MTEPFGHHDVINGRCGSGHLSKSLSKNSINILIYIIFIAFAKPHGGADLAPADHSIRDSKDFTSTGTQTGEGASPRV
jgi:hypothetical protein